MTGADLLVVGSGLIGTSLALAVAADLEVVLLDSDSDRLAAAVARGAGRAWQPGDTATTVVACVPPASTAQVLADLQGRGAGLTYTHVSSVQAAVSAKVERVCPDPSSVCGGHPLAGRETAGPSAALADLFAGRPWLVCPGPSTGQAHLDRVVALARAAGAEPAVLAPPAHDRAVALTSHLPQVVASALAAQLTAAGPDTAACSGPGLVDTTRLAGSPAGMWADVLALNADAVAPLLDAVARELDRLGAALRGGDEPVLRAAVHDLLARGAQGRALVPVKRGQHDEQFVPVAVSVSDVPGQFAGLLVTASEAGLNVEDVRVDHVPGRPRGVIELVVRAEARSATEQALRAGGWDVQDR